MRDNYLAPKLTTHVNAALKNNAPPRPQQKWFIGLWVLLVGIASVGWLIGLTWVAIWLVQRAVS